MICWSILMYMQNSLLFPREAIRSLKSARGEAFGKLVEHVCSLPACHEESLAFMLMMIQLNGCVSCATDSYRAMNGCAVCALRVLKRFKGSDQDLLNRYADALKEVRRHLHSGEAIPQHVAPAPAAAAPVLIMPA
jgi:hypothetical protein